MNIEYVVVSTNIIVLIGNLFCLIVLKYAWCFASQKLLPLKICDLALESWFNLTVIIEHCLQASVCDITQPLLGRNLHRSGFRG